MGSLQNIHFSDRPVVDGKSAGETNKDLLHLYYLAALERGLFSAARGLYVMSTPMTRQDIDTAVRAIADVVAELKPTIEDLWPELIGEAVPV